MHAHEFDSSVYTSKTCPTAMIFVRCKVLSVRCSSCSILYDEMVGWDFTQSGGIFNGSGYVSLD